MFSPYRRRRSFRSSRRTLARGRGGGRGTTTHRKPAASAARVHLKRSRTMTSWDRFMYIGRRSSKSLCTQRFSSCQLSHWMAPRIAQTHKSLKNLNPKLTSQHPDALKPHPHPNVFRMASCPFFGSRGGKSFTPCAVSQRKNQPCTASILTLARA